MTVSARKALLKRSFRNFTLTCKAVVEATHDCWDSRQMGDGWSRQKVCEAWDGQDRQWAGGVDDKRVLWSCERRPLAGMRK